ncbi:MAG: DUF4180 domain-containing protein [Cytophagaceae bacterium]|nr:DUF4180 domain-containing protein [Cytophagaceae bacterium]
MAEVLSSEIIIHTVSDGLDILVNLYYQDFDRIILHQKNISPDFFDLKSGIAGEMLQKFSNYRVRLAIIGDFSAFNSKSLNAFIIESNKGKQIHFVHSLEEAIQVLIDK